MQIELGAWGRNCRGASSQVFLPADAAALPQLKYWSQSPAGTPPCPPSRNKSPRRGQKPPHPTAAQARSLSWAGRLREPGAVWKAAQSKRLMGPVVPNSRAGVVPLDAEGFAPVGRLQQAKLQHERGVQGPPQEGVIAEHGDADDGGVHHGIFGEPARSDGALPSPCPGAAGLPKAPC